MLPTLSSLNVSYSPESRLRHWCSSIYLRIPPLHMEFHSPLLHSRKTVSDAVSRLSRGLSHQTYSSACARFTPNKSGQRSGPTYYRGCWHVVSRPFLVSYRHSVNFPLSHSFFSYNRALRSENLLHSRGVARSDFRPLPKIPYCCLP